MTRSSFGVSEIGGNRAYPLHPPVRRQSDWRDRLARYMPPMFPFLMIALAVTALFIEDYFLLEVFSMALCGVTASLWLTKNRSRYSWISHLFNKTTERITWMGYSLVAAFSVISPAFATGGGGSCSATNTLLGPIADAMIGVFSSAAEVGATGNIGQNICQVFVTFAAVIALLVIGTIIWGLFDQGRGSELGKAFTPLGLVLAAAVMVRISIKVVMGV